MLSGSKKIMGETVTPSDLVEAERCRQRERFPGPFKWSRENEINRVQAKLSPGKNKLEVKMNRATSERPHFRFIKVFPGGKFSPTDPGF